jgi:hypothetical protein
MMVFGQVRLRSRCSVIPAEPHGRFAVCIHTPSCPSSGDHDREAARVVAAHPEQGWSLLCNGVVLFDDTGELLPDGEVIAPHRPTIVRD